MALNREEVNMKNVLAFGEKRGLYLACTRSPSMQEAHVPGMSVEVDGAKYFLIHHTPADTIDKIDPGEMAKCAAAVAVMAYVVADLPQRLGE